MRYISIDKAVNGMVLAEDIYDDNGLLLSKKDVSINEELLQQLINSNINIITIYEDDEVKALINEEDKEKIINQLIGSSTNQRLFSKDLYSSVRGIVLETMSDIILDDNALYMLNELCKITPYTFKHAVSVALLSALIADWQKLDNEIIKKAIISGLFHQIGKLDIDAEILRKTENLSEEELKIVRNYNANCELFLNRLDIVDEEIIKGVKQSTEKLNGSGYPDGLKDEDISQIAKIVAVANVFDAAVNDKCYKEAISPFDVAIQLFEASLEELCPKCTLPLIKTIEEAFLGMKVELSNGEIGEVIFMNKLDSSRPLVKVDDKIYDLAMGKEKIRIKRMIST